MVLRDEEMVVNVEELTNDEVILIDRIRVFEDGWKFYYRRRFFCRRWSVNVSFIVRFKSARSCRFIRSFLYF